MTTHVTMVFNSIDEDDAYEFNTSISDARSEKYNLVCQAEQTGSLWELREMALTRGGLVNPELRQRIWPLLAGLSQEVNWLEESSKLFEPSNDPCSESEDRERDLIRRDVGRSVLFHHSCPSPNSVMGSFDEQSMESKAEMSTKRLAAVLTAVISAPLSSNDEDKPHYYQGLHDLGGVLLENLEYNEVLTAAILRSLCQTHLRDNTKSTFEDVKWFNSSCLMNVLWIVDPPVSQALVECGLDALLPMVLVKWLFTWFTHSVHGEEEASRLVDAFIASHPLLPFYVTIALLVHPRLRNDILTADLDDPSSMNMAIQNLPSQIKSDWKQEDDGSYITTQELIDTAISIMKRVPPRSLLDFVDDKDRATSMTLMKPLTSIDPSDTTNPCSRAKMASGVPLLMETQQSDTEWLRHFGPPVVVRPKAQRPRTIKQRLRQFVRSIVRQMPRNRGNQLALAYAAFVLIYVFCKSVFEIYLLFSSSMQCIQSFY